MHEYPLYTIRPPVVFLHSRFPQGHSRKIFAFTLGFAAEGAFRTPGH